MLTHQRTRLLAGAILASLFAANANAAQCSAASGERGVALLELYTSEGCNSCPPADAWVNELDKKGFSRERVVPLAFHVDYWDYIGWKDRFAQARFTERQRVASRNNGLGTIFTPQVQLNGVTMRRWGDNAQLAAALDLIRTTKARAHLNLALAPSGADELGVTAAVRVDDASARAGSALFLALYENNLVSEVRAGENRGVTLRHDYVVREWIGPLAIEGDAEARFTRQVKLAREWKRGDLGVAAFVEQGESGAVLQALALPACF
jgi:hypothetical protein